MAAEAIAYRAGVCSNHFDDLCSYIILLLQILLNFLFDNLLIKWIFQALNSLDTGATKVQFTCNVMHVVE